MAIKRKVNANWKGTGTEGEGHLNSSNKFFDNTPYSFKSRFENEDGKLGTNPEELIAAAHSGCYAMALSVAISQAGHTPDEIDANAEVVLDKEGEGFAIKEIKLTVKGSVSGMSEDDFLKMAEDAKKGCPISKALSAVPISLEASFK
ncbi:OsmC family protein [Marivirga arenosa]|uniref:OsmC family protein n=1 Tax=Marivirga arenosa TaxID=3059076 RepID=A0AA49GJ60_9BACT|nr:OsmC family protein [Marivirga sp. ABR2-2]WKK87798.2 OsmC family protein [Marivirga sp. ABR2-2]